MVTFGGATRIGFYQMRGKWSCSFGGHMALHRKLSHDPEMIDASMKFAYSEISTYFNASPFAAVLLRAYRVSKRWAVHTLPQPGVCRTEALHMGLVRFYLCQYYKLLLKDANITERPNVPSACATMPLNNCATAFWILADSSLI